MSSTSCGRSLAIALGVLFDDEIVAVAMIDRLVHHAEIVSLRGDSDRVWSPS